jgi:hypothetical protein
MFCDALTKVRFTHAGFKLADHPAGGQDGRQDQVRWGHLPYDQPPAAGLSTSASGNYW